MSERAGELRELLIRNFNEVPRERFVREPLYESACARLATGTAARKLGLSIDVLPPGKRSCPYHFHHAEEELFIVLEGTGTLRVAGELLPVKAGDVIFIPVGPEYPHQLINSSSAPLEYLSISTKEPIELCEYPDSGKLGTFSAALDVINRRGESLDYWEGEP